MPVETSNLESTLKAITEFADQAHGDQTRKYTPERYIVHPVRVMNLCREYTDDVTVLAAALLHDVLEDTPVTAEEIYEFLSGVMDDRHAKQTVSLVRELTDEYVKNKYPQWNRRTRKAREADRMEKTSPAAQTIKYADIIDNCKEIVGADRDFARVFIYECRNLLRRMNNGNQELYRRATQTIEDSIRELSSRN